MFLSRVVSWYTWTRYIQGGSRKGTKRATGGISKPSYLNVLRIPMREKSRKMAFSTPHGGHYELNVMPFGLKNAPAIFQRKIPQDVLAGLLCSCCLVYLNDIIVYSQTYEGHIKHLTLVFEHLLEHGLKLALKNANSASRAYNTAVNT